MTHRAKLIAASTLLLSSAQLIACPVPDPTASQQAEQPQVSVAVVSEVPAANQAGRAVDLAICLDTSGSMQGLIDAARIKLWDIVNDLALAKPTPRLRVALITFGNDGHNRENGWVNIDAVFTEDLDLVSQRLFALTTNGGTELVGRVLDVAGNQLDWTPGDDALKIVIVAGNESADQDTLMNFRDVCRSTIARGIMVDSIYCGPVADDLAPAWREVATLADGHFAAIDHQNGTIIVSTPFDDQLAAMSAELNTTYIPFGAQGHAYAMNQRQQDTNAVNMSTAVAAQRCETKANLMYRNAAWDLVDACREAQFKLEEVKDEDLPEAMRSMTIEQRRAHVAQMESRRGELQAKANLLTQQRQDYVAQEAQKQAGEADKSFDAAIRKAIRAQAQSKGFAFVEPAPKAQADPGKSEPDC